MRTFLLLAAFCGGVRATTVTYDNSALLNAAFANQLGAWLGEGDLALTRIFSTNGNPPGGWTAFHAAADGKGRTFTVAEALVCSDSLNCIVSNALIGGYNPVSWNTGAGYYLANSDAERKAFLFNLSSSLVYAEHLGGGYGEYQTVGQAGYGPTFGGGHDLILGDDFGTQPYARVVSYGPDLFTGTSIAGANSTVAEQFRSTFTLGRLEVFTIADVAGVPEPGSVAMVGGGLLAAWKLCRRSIASERVDGRDAGGAARGQIGG